MRVTPRPLIGILTLVAVVAIIVVGRRISGVDYDEVSDTTGNAFKAIVIPVGVTLVFLAVAATWLGWWRPVLFEQRRLGPSWLLLAPGLIGLVGGDYGAKGGGLVAVLAIGSLMIGINEELAARGILLVAFRGTKGELGVWFWTTLLFSLSHAGTVLAGAPVGNLVTQVPIAFLLGTILYVTRRATGVLFVGMLLHGAWDFMTYVNTDVDDNVSGWGVTAILIAAVGAIVALVAVRRVVRHEPSLGGEPGASLPAGT
jgi:CAAX protease family protein